MQIAHEVITAEEIAILKNYWEKNNHMTYVNGYPQDWHPLGHLADHVDRRLLIVNESRAGEIINRVVEKFFPGEQNIWANYQRQALPPTIHVDNYGKDRPGPTWTIVIALDTESRFRTILFKDFFNCCADLDDYLEECDQNDAPWKSDISREQDVEHMNRRGYKHNVCNYLEFDGTFAYQAGSAVIFDTNLAHCTSNWRKYPDVQYRDLVQIHVGKCSTASYDEEEHTTKGDAIPATLVGIEE